MKYIDNPREVLYADIYVYMCVYMYIYLIYISQQDRVAFGNGYQNNQQLNEK